MKRQTVLTAALAIGCAFVSAADGGIRMRSTTGGRSMGTTRVATPSRFKSPVRPVQRTPARSVQRMPARPAGGATVGRPKIGRSPAPRLTAPGLVPRQEGLRGRPGITRKSPIARVPVRRAGADLLRKIKDRGALPTRKGGKPDFKVGKDYHKKFGSKFRFGFCYTGKHHDHWSHCQWSDPYGCYLYYCPSACAWYYWCEPYECFFPVTYCPTGCYTY